VRTTCPGIYSRGSSRNRHKRDSQGERRLTAGPSPFTKSDDDPGNYGELWPVDVLIPNLVRSTQGTGHARGANAVRSEPGRTAPKGSSGRNRGHHSQVRRRQDPPPRADGTRISHTLRLNSHSVGPSRWSQKRRPRAKAACAMPHEGAN
jgi:hypothetical protein